MAGPEPKPGSARIERVLPDGRPDPHFGSAGVLTSKLGFPPPSTANLSAEQIAAQGTLVSESDLQVTGLTVDGHDRPIVSGKAGFEFQMCHFGIDGGDPITEVGKAYLARLSDDGQPDPSFGEAGVYAAEQPSQANLPMVNRDDGLEYLSTDGNPCDSRAPVLDTPLIRVDANGAAIGATDQADDSRNRVATNAVEDRRGGTLLLGEFGAPESKVEEIARTTRSGRFDPSFAGAGHRPLATPDERSPGALGVDHRGRPLLLGTKHGDTLWLQRMTVGGGLDRNFGRRSEVQTKFAHLRAQDVALVVDSKGRIVVGAVGRPTNPAQGSRFYLARYLGEPAPR